MAILKFDAKHGPWEDGGDFSLDFYNFGFGHILVLDIIQTG